MKYALAAVVAFVLMFNSSAAFAKSANTYRYWETSSSAGPVAFGVGSNSYTTVTVFMRNFIQAVGRPGHYRAKPNYPTRCAFLYQSGGIFALFVVYARNSHMGMSVCKAERRALSGLQSWRVYYWATV